MHRPNFAMRLMSAVAGLFAGGRAFGDEGFKTGVKSRKHGSSPAWEGRPAFARGPRIAFTARSGRTIVRETVKGSDHERRLLRRKDARKIGLGYADPDPDMPVGC